MADAKMIERANKEVLDPLSDLDGAMTNVEAFWALLKDLRARDLSVVKAPHVLAITMVRAGILRAVVGTIMACLDPPDRRGNRASVGQILDTLDDDPTLADLFATDGQGSTTALRQARESYEGLRKSDSFDRVRRLRDKAVAHTLNTPAPEVDDEAIYELCDGAEQIVIDLYAACGRPARPSFLHYRDTTAEHAKIFWDTYFSGMAHQAASPSPTPSRAGPRPQQPSPRPTQ
jgi:AbiU2